MKQFEDGLKNGAGKAAGIAVAGVAIAGIAGLLVGGPAGALLAVKSATVAIAGKAAGGNS